VLYAVIAPLIAFAVSLFVVGWLALGRHALIATDPGTVTGPGMVPMLNWRTVLAFLHDAVMCAVAWLIAFWLRFNFDDPQMYLGVALKSLPWVVAINVVIFVSLGLYRGIWRYASLPDLKRILVAVLICATAVPAALAMAQIAVPRSVFVIAQVFLAMAMGGNRFAYRAWKENDLTSLAGARRTPVFVIGAQDSALSLIKERARSQQWRVVGVLDEDRSRHGRELHGIKILGPLSEIGARNTHIRYEARHYCHA
jgi:FlaA1/EpsC-like NDP-sugar epimerase